MRSIRLVIASGKGGTGKTTVATNLAYVAGLQGRSVAYVDCDVEEPNGHLFLRPDMMERRSVSRPVVVVDSERCNTCGRCESVCQFSALVRLGQKILAYPHLCHSCGTCLLVCPSNALIETPEVMGTIQTGTARGVRFAHGILEIGQAKATGLIRAVKAAVSGDGLTIIDAPPGASCPVVETLRGADRVLLVCEPTPFGLHDATLILQLVQAMGIPVSVVVNRCDLGDGQLQDLCREQAIPMLAQIPEDMDLARAYSEGVMASECMPQYRELFANVLSQLLNEPPVAARAEAVNGTVAEGGMR